MSVAPEQGGVDASGLEAAIMADDSAQIAAAKSPVEPPKTEDKPQAEEDKPAVEEAKSEEPQESEEKSEDEPVETEDAPPVDEKKGEKEGGIKIGGRLFKTEAEAIAEAQRIIGRNGNLAGDVTRLTEEKAELQQQLEDALEANQLWAENAKEGIVDPDLLAERVIEKYESKKANDQAKLSMKEQVEAMTKLPHYEQVQDVILQIADKKNPLTGKDFSPQEAYDYACLIRGIQKTEAKPKPKPKPPEPPPSGSTTRITGSRSTQTTPEPKERTLLDDELSRQFSTY